MTDGTRVDSLPARQDAESEGRNRVKKREAAPRRSSGPWLPLLVKLIAAGPVVILAGLVLVMSFASPVFLTERNLSNLGEQTSLVAVLAIGMLLVILVQGIDLSVGAVVALSGTVGALVARDQTSVGVLVILSMCATGALVGLFNGLILVKGRVPHALVVTLATLGIARGLALIVSDGKTIVGLPDLVLTLGSGDLGPIPWSVIVVAVLGLLAWVMTRRTVWGRWIYAVGGDPEAAKRVGIPVGRVVMSTFIICGLCAGVAGVLAAGRTNVGAPTTGVLLELDAATAVIIGGASFFGGRGTVINALVGALILGIIRNGLNLLEVSPFYQTVAVGTMILIAIELDVLRGFLEDKLRTRQARSA